MFGFQLPKTSAKKNIMIGAIILVFGLLSIYIFRNYAVPLIYKKNQPNLEHNTDMGINKQTVEVLFFMLIGVLIAKKQNHIGII